MSEILTFGGRLRMARREAGLSGPEMVDHINGRLLAINLPAVNLNTYYSWEHIGTPKEIIKGKRYPHPATYSIILEPLTVTGYWLWFGDMGGRIVKYKQDVPGYQAESGEITHDEQISAIRDEDELHKEFRRVATMATATQRNALLMLLKSIRG